MKIRDACILKISMGLSILVLTSCEGTKVVPVQEQEKCQVDGANLYVKCSDGRERVIKLGYGKFFIMNGGNVSEANDFCGEAPANLGLNIRNAHYLFKIESLGSVTVEMPGSIHSDCRELEEYGNLRNIKRAKIETTHISGPALM